MACFDAIVIGSGPAGTMAARALKGRRVLVLDVGREPRLPSDTPGNLYEARRNEPDLFPLLIGEEFESLRNLRHPPISLKLKAPYMKYVVEGSEQLSPVHSSNFDAAMSFATGGLANAWGAGVYRFSAPDLEGFPLTAAQLEPYYDELTRHIGIGGTEDSLAPYVGSATDLLPPAELSPMARDLLAGYRSRRSVFAAQGVTVGQTRNAVLTRPHRGRPAYSFGNREFFLPRDPAVYNPAYTLRAMVEAGEIAFEPGHLALRYAETAEGVEVFARNLATGATVAFRGRTLILAAGTLNSAKLALASADDFSTRLPLLDNPMSCLPFFRLRRMGEKIDARDGSFSQLTIVQEFEGALLQGSVFGAAGPLRSDVLFDLPLSIGANAAVLRLMTAATGMVMLFYPAAPHPENYLRLAPDGALELCYGEPGAGNPGRGRAENVLSRLFRKAGFFCLARMCQYPGMGSSIHYAGTLPMSAAPGPYQLYPDGRLFGTRAVYVADGACFPHLPAKNLTFTIMANAMRIASGLKEHLM